MKFKNFVIVKDNDARKQLDEAIKAGRKQGAKDSKDRIEQLEKTLARKEKIIEGLNEEADARIERHMRKVQKLEATIAVYESDRDEARDVIKAKMENEDAAAMLQAKKEGIEAREAKVKDREARVGEKEEGEYKHGYADGVADGVRKISEITQTDRDNAMKVAMVAAASHTPTANLKELNNVHQLTEGTADKKAE